MAEHLAKGGKVRQVQGFTDKKVTLEEAIRDDEHCRCLVDYHKARIEIWRTQAANQRAIDRAI